MNADASRGQVIALLILMLAAGAVAWQLQLGPRLRVDASMLGELPDRVGSWQAIDIPLEAAVESELAADFNLQRVYHTRTGERLWLYVGYYGTQRGGRPEHTPRGCYAGAGWGILATRVLDVDAESGLRANEYLVERDGQRRLIHFWYRSHRRTGMLGGLDQNIDRLLGRLFDSRADGALIRVSTPILDEGPVFARGQLLSFASRIDPLIGERWPTESPCDGQEDACEALAMAPKPGTL